MSRSGTSEGLLYIITIRGRHHEGRRVHLGEGAGLEKSRKGGWEKGRHHKGRGAAPQWRGKPHEGKGMHLTEWGKTP